MGTTPKVGMAISVETDDGTYRGKVLALKNGEALVKWRQVTSPSWIDVLDLHRPDGAPFDWFYDLEDVAA